MGCGPGNLFRSVDGSPKVLIGVDISSKALMHARELGYTPLLADVHDTPLISGFADLVTANAVLHHIDDVAAVLTESARLVKPGGMLITDEDPLACEYTLRGLGRFTSYLRSCIPLARVRNHPHRSWKFNSFREQRYRQKTEIHNRFPGDGIKKELFYDILEPLGFAVKLYPHSMIVGKSVFEGDRGHSSFWLQMTQRLAGMDAEKTESGLSVMCVAKRNRN
jgi:SAM-dependent methyltransferase